MTRETGSPKRLSYAKKNAMTHKSTECRSLDNSCDRAIIVAFKEPRLYKIITLEHETLLS